MGSCRLHAAFSSNGEFLHCFDGEIGGGSLTVPGPMPAGGELFDPCVVEVRVGEQAAVEVTGWIASLVPGVGVGVLLGGVPPALAALALRLRPPAAPDPAPTDADAPDADAIDDAADADAPDADADATAPEDHPADAPPTPATVAQALDALTVTEKMRLALSGTREQRFALVRDINKILHVYVMRNPRTGLDEAQYASKLPNLSPEALKFISEHPQWALDTTVCGNLVRNPKTPSQIAIRLLDRVSPTDLRIIARGGARQPIVQAARKKLNL